MNKQERDDIAQAFVGALADEHEYALMRASGRWDASAVSRAKAHSDASQRHAFGLLWTVVLVPDEPSEPASIIHSVPAPE